MRQFRPLSLIFILCLLAIWPALSGCANTDYALSVAIGELKLLASAVPIESALDDPELTEEQRQKLAFVVRVRDYAEEVIGLSVGDSYRNFVKVKDDTLAWNLSASKKDAFEPYVWRLPFVGSIPYLGFFQLDQARAERDLLVEEGYDTAIYEVDAYSTLGLLPDPVASSLLKRDWLRLADTVIHECLHNTIWRDNDTNYSETMAVFVGRAGALEFLAYEFGEDSEVVIEARQTYEDDDRFRAFMVSLRTDLRKIYDSDQTSTEKIQARKPILDGAGARFANEVLPFMYNQDGFQAYTDFPYNNAFLLLYERYGTELHLFQAIHEFTGGNWGQTLGIFQAAAEAEDAYAYLRYVLDQESATP